MPSYLKNAIDKYSIVSICWEDIQHMQQTIPLGVERVVFFARGCDGRWTCPVCSNVLKPHDLVVRQPGDARMLRRFHHPRSQHWRVYL